MSLSRRQLLRAGLVGGVATALPLARQGSAAHAGPDKVEWDYIVVGSGAGGGPLAANLARRGFSVLLLEAGLDDVHDFFYSMPLVSAAFAPEDPRSEWQFFVRHYTEDAQQRRDSKTSYNDDGSTRGVYYPRAATVGGCTAHNALIAMKPTNDDWDEIADLTGDASWSSASMNRYFARLEDNGYGPYTVPGPGHGYNGWLGTEVFDPRFTLENDPQIVRSLVAAALQFTTSPEEEAAVRAALDGDHSAFLSTDPTRPGLLARDVNSGDVGRDGREGLFSLPLHTRGAQRNGPREFIAQTIAAGHPLRLQTGALVTRVVMERPGRGSRARAVGVEYVDAAHVYEADRNATPTSAPRRVVRAKREIILSGGAFNTPQLLKLSGIGPADELRRFGIEPVVDLPGVGENLQDRYEITVVSDVSPNFSIFDSCTFFQTPDDPCLSAWSSGQVGPYSSIGVWGGAVKRSSTAEVDPDLWIFGGTFDFRGYYPGFSATLADDTRTWTWGILKGQTRNAAGSVTLRSASPFERPDINFRYFEDGTLRTGAAEADLDAVADAVEMVRRIIAQTDALMAERGGAMTEVLPGPGVQTREQIKDYVRDETWGHHASCSAKIGAADDPMAVLDSEFRVRGTDGLRVVDASAFPKIPGFFIVLPTYMISEKAADVIAGHGRTTAATVSGRSQVPS